MSNCSFFCGVLETADIWRKHLRSWIGSPSERETKDLRSEPRWMAHERVGLFLLREDGEMEQGEGNLIDRSETGARLWSSLVLSEGDRFLIVDSQGNEGEAAAAWVRPEPGGALIGARVDWVGAVLSNPERSEAELLVR